MDLLFLMRISFQLVSHGDHRLSLHPEAVHRAPPPREEHPAKHDDPEQVSAELGEDQPERAKQFGSFETDEAE